MRDEKGQALVAGLAAITLVGYLFIVSFSTVNALQNKVTNLSKARHHCLKKSALIAEKMNIISQMNLYTWNALHGLTSSFLNAQQLSHMLIAAYPLTNESYQNPDHSSVPELVSQAVLPVTSQQTARLLRAAYGFSSAARKMASTMPDFPWRYSTLQSSLCAAAQSVFPAQRAIWAPLPSPFRYGFQNCNVSFKYDLLAFMPQAEIPFLDLLLPSNTAKTSLNNTGFVTFNDAHSFPQSPLVSTCRWNAELHPLLSRIFELTSRSQQPQQVITTVAITHPEFDSAFGHALITRSDYDPSSSPLRDRNAWRRSFFMPKWTATLLAQTF